MRILIFGVSGMLGHKLYQRLRGRHEVFGTIRGSFDQIEEYGIFTPESVIDGVRVEDVSSIEKAIESCRPEAIVNAIGVIKQLLGPNDVVRALEVNSIFPHRLKDIALTSGSRVITVSTDCVFDGSDGDYSETDPPTARDLYGMSKLLGELDAPGCLTLRTSMIGRELGSKNSIVEWFLANRSGRVEGFRRAMYSGLTTIELSAVIESLIIDHPGLDGLFNVGGEPITKYDLLTLINEAFEAGVTVVPDDRVALDRTLNTKEFTSRTGYVPPSWSNMVAELAHDPTPYDQF